VSGSNLLREKMTLPQDFQGKLNLLFIPFEQWQQMEVDSWMPLAKEVEQQVNDLAYYELPTIQSRNPIYQMFLNEGMRAGIPNPKTRERTITLYVDKAAPAKSTSASIMIGGSASSFVSTDFPRFHVSSVRTTCAARAVLVKDPQSSSVLLSVPARSHAPAQGPSAP